MVLEASMIVVDNSESSRNGDYVPSRFEAQEDAVNLIFSAKIQANPESSVGLMSMGGNGPEVLTTLTTDMGKILDGLHRTKIRGSPHFSTGINIAALALKHRQNKSQRQRIIVFTCSTLPEDEKSLVKLAKRMKKNNINIDIVAFGDLSDENVKKLEAFNEAIKGGDGSSLTVIPPSSNLLSDAIVTSPIIGGEAAPGGGAGGSGGAGGEGEQEWQFGVDPSMDPELALALRMSYEEEKARQEREKQAQEGKDGKTELEGIKEEGAEESRPLLDESGEPSGSGSGSKEGDKKDKDDGDKMDTA
ncbi:uncharacterized protein J3D65DRAFT_614976 [Phyllosticta citribraziliensis]|uniref:VWFA domain-containing protein n=1 Tax=Phyllosticta citribraziliensis TaxID=989973 RepID=A0ABR1M765_9PEZI